MVMAHVKQVSDEMEMEKMSNLNKERLFENKPWPSW